MISKNKHTIRTACAVVLLLLLAYLFRIFPVPVEGAVQATILTALRNLIHVSLVAAWCISLNRRLMHPQIRQLAMGSAILMVFWLLAKIVKYEFLVTSTDMLGRYIWYSYYIPMVMIPLFGVFIIAYIGKPDTYQPSPKLKLLYIPAFLMLGLVFTNDLHQWVFSFHNGIENYDKDYGYGLPYFVIMAWYILLSLYFVVMLLKKSRVPGSKKMQKLPLAIVLCSVGFWIVYVLKLVSVDLTVVDCLIIAALLESAIQCGMIPSNTGHQEIFRATTVPIQVLDLDNQPHYVSAGALPVSEEQLRASIQGTVLVGDTLLSSAPITAGRVVWQDDIRRVNELRQHLQDTQEQLSEESVLLQAEAEVKEKRAKVDEQNRLYDQIAKEVETHLIRVDALLQRIEQEPENTHSLMTQICVIGSYIKRRGNLLLLSEEHERINAAELEYCIRESLENLQLGGAFTSLNSKCEGSLIPAQTVAVYDFFETVVERLLDSITAMMVNLTCKNGRIRINIQLGCQEEIAHHVLEDVTIAAGSFTYEITDEDVIIDLLVDEGGKEIC